jgi:hypothetical protein
MQASHSVHKTVWIYILLNIRDREIVDREYTDQASEGEHVLLPSVGPVLLPLVYIPPENSERSEKQRPHVVLIDIQKSRFKGRV